MPLLDNIDAIDLSSSVSIEQEVDDDDKCTALGVHPDGEKLYADMKAVQ